MARKFWTERELAVLRRHYHSRGAGWCAARLDRSVASVYQAAVKQSVARRRRCMSDDHAIRAIRRLHPLGWTDTDIARDLARQHKCAVDRHRISRLRRKLRLPDNIWSDRQRRRVAVRTREQLQAAGLSSIGQLRVKAWARWKRSLGWPTSLSVRAVQALEALWAVGPGVPITRLQLCALMGVEPRTPTSPTSNAKGGTVLAELARAGLIERLARTAKSPNGWVDVYFLKEGVKPNGRRHEVVRSK